MASIRKRNDKWHVQIRRSGSHHVSRTFHKKADARAWAQQMEAQADRHDLPKNTGKELKSRTVRNRIERYRDTVVIKKRCRKVETDMLSVLLRRSFARLSLSEASSATFSSYRDKRLEAVKPATVRRELGLLQHMFEVARKEWAVPLLENPLASVRKPTLNNRRDRRLETDEFEKLLNACPGCRSKQLEPLFQLALATAMRRSELLNIRWQDIDFERKTLHIPHTKNGHARTIPRSESAIQILNGLQGNDPDRVFTLTPNAVRLAWEHLRRRAGITDLHFHDPCHEAISRFFEKGLTVPGVALISGHRNYRMLFRYTHLRAEDLVEKLA